MQVIYVIILIYLLTKQFPRLVFCALAGVRFIYTQKFPISYTPWQTEGRGNVMRLVHQVQCTPILWLFNIIIARVSAPTSFSVFFISLGLRLNRWVLIWGMFLHAIYWSRVFFSWLRFLVLFFYARGKPSLAPIFFWPMALPLFNLPLGGPLSSFLRVAIL